MIKKLTYICALFAGLTFTVQASEPYFDDIHIKNSKIVALKDLKFPNTHDLKTTKAVYNQIMEDLYKSVERKSYSVNEEYTSNSSIRHCHSSNFSLMHYINKHDLRYDYSYVGSFY